MAKDILESDDSDIDDGGARLDPNSEFKINEDFARRFTHNKKREEIKRLEDKLSKPSGKRKRAEEDSQSGDEETSSTSEDEDNEGELATEQLDSEIFATLNAIKSKDPRVYDANVKFYTSLEEEGNDKIKGLEKEKPIYLRDYHREQLLHGGSHPEADGQPLSYNQEQEALKKSIVGEIHAAAQDPGEHDDDQADDFLVAKKKEIPTKESTDIILDIENADKDPETYLSKFMSARAWVPTSQSQFQPFESDDSEEERRAEEFEEAYNLRFEDPQKSNEKLRTHARDMAAKYSVRREELNPRKKKREAEKEKKELAKQEIREEKARLRKLKIEEAEEKVRRIKRAAGLKSKDIKADEWSKFVNDDWHDAQWETEMQKHFGDQYYAEADGASEEDEEEKEAPKKRKLKKPKWDDDIDIKDLVPDFEDKEKANFSLTDEEADNEKPFEARSRSKDGKKESTQVKRDAKKERRIIEQLVDNRLELDAALSNGPAKTSGFRYRDTSPTSFGLSAHDILMAEDSQLNQYVGLKRLAAFRDPEKKRKDQKHLGKRARLRKWRAETFGSENGPELNGLSAPPQSSVVGPMEREEYKNGTQSEGKKKRRRPKKTKVEENVPS